MTPPRLRSFIPVVILCAVLSACLDATPGRDVLQLNNVGRIPGINSAGGAVVVNGVRASYANYEGSPLGSRAEEISCSFSEIQFLLQRQVVTAVQCVPH